MKKLIFAALHIILAYAVALGVVSWFTPPFLLGPFLYLVVICLLWLPFHLGMRRMESEWLRWSVPAPAPQAMVEEFAGKLGVDRLDARMIHSLPEGSFRRAPTLYQLSSGALIMGAESWFKLSPGAQRFGIASVLARRKLFRRKHVAAWRFLFASFVFALALWGTLHAAAAVAILICIQALGSHYMECLWKAHTDQLALALTGDKEAALEYVKLIEVWPTFAKYRQKRIAAMPCD